MGGAFQTVFRAELTAVIEVLLRAAADGALTLLVDNLGVVDGLTSLLGEGTDAHDALTGPQCEDADLWRVVARRLAQLPGLRLQVRWVPSHTRDEKADPDKVRLKLERARAQEGWEDCWFHFNELADAAAGRGLALHPGEAEEIDRDAVVGEIDAWAVRALGLMADIVMRPVAPTPGRERRADPLERTGRARGRPRVHFSPGRGPTTGGHLIQRVADGAWRCSLCAGFAATPGTKQSLRYSRCRVRAGAAHEPGSVGRVP